MGIVIDLIALAIIAAFAIVGFIRGFAATLVCAAKWIAAFLIATTFASAVAGMTYDVFVAKGVEDKIAEYTQNSPITEISTLENICEKLGYDFDKFYFEDSRLRDVKDAVDAGDSVPHAVSVNVIKLLYLNAATPICYAVLFILVIIAGIIVQKVSKFANKIPLIGAANQWLGLLLGIMYGFAAVFLLCSVVSAFIQITGDKVTWLNSSTFDNAVIRYLIPYCGYHIP